MAGAAVWAWLGLFNREPEGRDGAWTERETSNAAGLGEGRLGEGRLGEGRLGERKLPL